jgi:hypothetical protein
MGRKSKAEKRGESASGQYLSLAVAAHLARTQLIPDPLKVYDSQHLSEMLNVVAQALARTAPLQITEAPSGEKRTLSPAELEGALAKRGATILVLKDGRTLTSVCVRRSDLRQAIALLKAVGLPELGQAVPAAAAQKPAGDGNGNGNANANGTALRARFAEVEKLLTPPLIPAQVNQAKAAAVWIARHAPHGRVANLAMQLMSSLHETRGTEEIPGGFRMALARLRAALEESANA